LITSTERVNAIDNGWFSRVEGNTCRGSSGAPVYGADHRLIGVHFAGGGSAVTFAPGVVTILDRLLLPIAQFHRLRHGLGDSGSSSLSEIASTVNNLAMLSTPILVCFPPPLHRALAPFLSK